MRKKKENANQREVETGVKKKKSPYRGQTENNNKKSSRSYFCLQI